MTASIQDVLDGRARWCVVEGDSLAILPTLPERAVDHVICDPPYEAEAHTKARRSRAVAEGRQLSGEYKIGFDAITPGMRAECGRQLSRLSRKWILAFCQVEAIATWRTDLEAGGAKWVRGQVWIKPDSTPQLTGDRPAQGYESIATAWAGVGRMRWNGGGRRGVYTHNVSDGKRPDHPTPKPIALMLELVSLFTDPDDLILDPFGGSGTTGVAALQLGRRVILIERDPKYAALCRERLQAAESGLTLNAARAGQISLFGAAQ